VWPNLLSDPSLYILLLRIDEDLYAQAQARGCPYCGAALHAAHYPRKPRGGPARLPESYDRRLSLCCSRDGCRRRTTPPSVRFLGRRVYLAAMLVLVSAMQHGPGRVRMAKLRELFGVSRWTVCRWRHWWREVFDQTRFWQEHRGRLREPPARSALPLSLLERFVGAELRERLVALLRFLSPLTVPDR
jgi:hypothetical protein